jgi:hypothetical protein
VAAAAARLRAELPDAAPAEVAARLVETAEPVGPLLVAGGGVPDLDRARDATVVAEPALVAFPRQQALADFTAQATVTVRNLSEEEQSLTPEASLPGTEVTLSPETVELDPGGTAELAISAEATGDDRPPRHLTGTLTLGDSTVQLGLPVGPPPPAELSELELVQRGARTTGVSFTAGSVTTEDDALAVQPLGNLTLEIVDADDRVVRELTPPGGARNLLPGEYAYTLTREAREGLGDGPYRFRATALAPSTGPPAPPTVRTSPEWEPR